MFNDFEMVLPNISQVYSSSGNVRKSLLSGVHEPSAYDSPLNFSEQAYLLLDNKYSMVRILKLQVSVFYDSSNCKVTIATG